MEKEGIEESKTAAPRGMRDAMPAEAARLARLRAALREVFELYGFEPLETPALENWEVLSSKYAGGEEILKEVYSLEDQGGRKLGLRYDLTVPMCRVLAANPKLALPFKRYQIQQVWRDGPVKLGRYREFWQCDVDTVGVQDVIAEAELLALTMTAFQRLDIGAFIKLNNRKLLNGILEYAGVPAEKRAPAILSIDKLAKIGSDGVRKELLEEREVPIPAVEKLMQVLELENQGFSNSELLDKVKSLVKNDEGRQGAKELEELFAYCEAFQVLDLRFEPSLARGLAYYTGTVFEAFLKDGAIKNSIAGGGRLDEMIGKFLGSAQKIPAVGISFGLDVLADAMRLREGEKERESNSQVFIVPIGTLKESIEIAARFRSAGFNTLMDLLGRGPSKNLDWASKQKIPIVVIAGPKELAVGKIRLKNMRTGEETLLSIDRALELARRMVKS